MARMKKRKTVLGGVGVLLGAAAVDCFQHYAFECRLPSSLIFGAAFGLALVGGPTGVFVLLSSERVEQRAKVIGAVILSAVSLVVLIGSGFALRLTHICP